MKGKYLSYAAPKTMRRGRMAMFLTWPFDKGIRKATKTFLRAVLRNPFRLFQRSYIQSVMFIQPVDCMADGGQSMCDGCPDITVILVLFRAETLKTVTYVEVGAVHSDRVTGLMAILAVLAAENLLSIPRSRVPGGEFHTGELKSLPFADDSFDLITGFNSFQYAGNPRAALAEAKRVARQGASVVIMTWGEPEGMEAASLVAAIKPLLPPPPPGAPGPFALSDESALRDFASSAGLSPIEVFDVPAPWQYPDLATALRGIQSAGVAVRAMENSSEAEVETVYSKSLAPFRQSDGTYRIEATFRYLVAHAYPVLFMTSMRLTGISPRRTNGLTTSAHGRLADDVFIFSSSGPSPLTGLTFSRRTGATYETQVPQDLVRHDGVIEEGQRLHEYAMRAVLEGALELVEHLAARSQRETWRGDRRACDVAGELLDAMRGPA